MNIILTKAGSAGLGDLGGGAGRVLAANAFITALPAAAPLTAFATFRVERGSSPLKICGRDAKYLHPRVSSARMIQVGSGAANILIKESEERVLIALG